MKNVFITFSILIAFCSMIHAETWKQVNSGYIHTMAIKSDGSLWGWGRNMDGELGNSKTDQTITEPLLIDDVYEWKYVCGGVGYTLAIQEDGSLWSWGRNYNGCLGDGCEKHRAYPQMISQDKDWAYVFAGWNTSFAIKENGELWGWGFNKNGELCIGNENDQFEPVRIGDESNWVTIDKGYLHIVALKEDGTIWGWGYTDVGQLGLGYFDTYYHPMTQIGNDDDWVDIKAGFQFTIALKEDGSIWGWGANNAGQIGLGAFTNFAFSPRQIGYDNDWVAIEAGTLFSFAVKEDGSLWGWGANTFGVLGDGTSTKYRYYPAKSNDDHFWTQLSASTGYLSTDDYIYGYSLMALKDPADCICGSGDNYFGQLGNGTKDDINKISCGTGVLTSVVSAEYQNLNMLCKPNPFSQFQTTNYELRQAGHVTLKVLDMLGNEVSTLVDGFMPAGRHEARFDAAGLPEGMYFLKLQAGGEVVTKKVIYIK